MLVRSIHIYAAILALATRTMAGGSFHITIGKDIVKDVTPSGTQTVDPLSGSQMSASLAVDSTAKAAPSSLDAPLSSPSPILPSSSSAPVASSPAITSMIPATTANPSSTFSSTSASASASSSNSTASGSSSSTTNLVKIVVPAVVGGAIVLVLLTLLIVCCCGSRNRAQDHEDKEESLDMREIPTPHSMHEKRANVDSFAGSDRSYVPYHDGQIEGKHESTILPPSPQPNQGLFGGKPIVPPPVASPKFANLFNITSSRAENTDRNLSPLSNQVANASKTSLSQRLSARFSGAFSFTSASPSTPNRNSTGYFEFDSRDNAVPEVPSIPAQNNSSSPQANKSAASLAPPAAPSGRHMSDPFAAPNAGPVMYDNITGKVTPMHGDKHMSTQTYGSASDSDFDDGRTTMYGGRRDTQASAWTDNGLQVPSFIAEGGTNSTNSVSNGSDQRQVSVASSEPLPSSPEALPGTESGEIEELHEGYVSAKPTSDPPRDSTISIYQNYSTSRDSTMPVAEAAGSSSSPRRPLASPVNQHLPTPSTASSTFSFYSLAEAPSNSTAGGGGITVDDRGEASMGVLEPPTPTGRRPRKSEESHRSGKSARSMTPQNQGVLGWAKRAVGNRVSGLWASQASEQQQQQQQQPAPTSAPSGHKREDSFGYAV